MAFYPCYTGRTSQLAMHASLETFYPCYTGRTAAADSARRTSTFYPCYTGRTPNRILLFLLSFYQLHAVDVKHHALPF